MSRVKDAIRLGLVTLMMFGVPLLVIGIIVYAVVNQTPVPPSERRSTMTTEQQREDWKMHRYEEYDRDPIGRGG